VAQVIEHMPWVQAPLPPKKKKKNQKEKKSLKHRKEHLS
jgi:hypothetical protein